MTFVFVGIDGCGAEPSAALGGKTPLAASAGPNFAKFLAAGALSRTLEIPAGPASLRALDWAAALSGSTDLVARAAGLAALDANVAASPNDWVLTARLASIANDALQPFAARGACLPEDADDRISPDSFAARHAVTDAEYNELWQALRETLAPHGVEIHSPIGDRALVVVRAKSGPLPFSESTRTISVDTLAGRSAMDAYPRGPGGDLLLSWMNESVAAFESHPVNVRRLSSDLAPATNVWLEGLCRVPAAREPQPLAFPSGRGEADETKLDSSQVAVFSNSPALRGWAKSVGAAAHALPSLEIPRPGAKGAPQWIEARQLVETAIAQPGVAGVFVHLDAGLLSRSLDAETAQKATEWITGCDEALHPLIAGGATLPAGSVSIAWPDVAPGAETGLRPSSPARGKRFVTVSTK